MKLKYFIFTLLVINTISINQYTILALGDTGQVDSWWQQNQKLRIIDRIHDKLATDDAVKTSLRQYAKIILDEMKSDENLSPEDNISPYQIFKNFGSFFKCSLLPSSINSIVLLGDGIYTEHKAKGRIIASSFKLHNAPFTPSPDLPVLLNGLTARNYYINFGSEAFGQINEVLEKRIFYAANKLGQMLIAPEGRTCFPAGPKSVTVLPGNHAFDIDQGLEEALIASQFDRVKANIPNIDVETLGNLTILSLDVNLMQFACLDKRFFTGFENFDPLLDTSKDNDIFKNCLNGESGSRTLKTVQDARDYLLKMVASLIEIKNRPANWRIFRTHNPLFNPEVDFNSVLQMNLKIKCNGKDLSIIWNENIQGTVTCNFDNSAGAISFTKVIRYSLIDFFLVSHFHAAMLVAAPWADNYANGDFNGQGSNLKCINRFNDFFELVEPGVKSTIPSQPIADNCKATTDNNIILEPAGSHQNLYISFVIGNSGRYLDPIPLDTKSNGHIIWARSTSDSYIDQNVGNLKVEDLVNNTCTFTDAQKAKECVEKIWGGIRDNSKPSFGWTVLKFELDGSSVKIEFNELNSGSNQATLTNSFNLVRRQSGVTKVHKLQTMPQKRTITGNKKLKIKKI